MNLIRNPIAQMADKLRLNCHQPATAHQLHELVAQENLDYLVVCAYGFKLLPETLAATKYGCINIHASLLPRWRGAAPIERALLAGDKQTGVTTMLMANKIDAGKILLAQPLTIGPQDTGGSLRIKLAELGADLIVKTLRQFTQLVPQPQDKTQVSYARKITKQEALIDWNETAVAVLRKIRAFNPRPGAFMYLGKERVKILAAKLNDLQGKPGCILSFDRDQVIFGCASGSVTLLEMQSPGKRPLATAAWLRGKSEYFKQSMLGYKE